MSSTSSTTGTSGCPSVAAAFEPSDDIYRLRETCPAVGDPLFGPVPRDDDALVDLARQHTIDGERRQRIVNSLVSHWSFRELPAASRDAVNLIRQPGTHIVIAGQQPALGGGPLFILTKALSAARFAARLRSLEIPAVALFWIADEDHDVRELASGAIPRPGNDPWRLEIPLPTGRVPIGELRLPDEGVPIVDAFREALGAAEAGAHVQLALGLLETHRDPSPSRWFRDLLMAVLDGEGVLPVTPDMLRQEAAPVLAAELARPGALAHDVERAVARMRDLELPVPIPEPEALPFFWLGDDGARHRLDAVEGGARLRGQDRQFMDQQSLEASLEGTPERFSPDALLRPLVQDHILQPFATIAGPTEMAYHLELADAYAARGIRRPLLVPRARVRILDGEQARALRTAGIDVSEVVSTVHPAVLAPSPVAESAIDAITARGEALLDAVESLEDRSPALTRRVSRLARRWRADLDKLIQAVRREMIDGVGSERQTLAAVHGSLWPGGRAAERELSMLYFLARFGPELVPAIGACYDPFDSRPRIVTLGDTGETP